MRRTSLALILACLAGCAALKQDSLDERYGPPDATRFDQTAVSRVPGLSYRDDVRPILERRCVVCHGCYDAPCQLKLTAWGGIARGGSKEQPYDATRLRETAPTRLFVDAQLPSQWRDKGFHAVLNERTPSPQNALAASVLYRSLALKQAHPLPQDKVLSDDFDFGLDRSQSCPRLEEYDRYERDHPLGGMPYGLPGLGEREMGVLTRWLAAGSPNDPPAPLPAELTRQVQTWERFLNGASLKEQLMSRYLYEHLYLGHLVFEGDARRQAFRLVRSASAPGAPAQPLATRRPYDDPGVARVFYRLEPEGETLLAKTHMPYLLSQARMAKFRGWFLDADYKVEALPSYAIERASNPFVTFAAIPPEMRYRFLLDEAEFFVMNFIKGPVCRGQTALNVIDDRFWVLFLDPKVSADDTAAQLLVQQADDLRLPAALGSNASVLVWRDLAQRETRALAAKSEFLNQRHGGTARIDLDYIWDGDGRNGNAALTVFRHFDSASVVKGLVGDLPKTAWVMGYGLFERIYYLLVTGYDPFGSVGHQLSSRLYMDFMRMEGESNLLMFLPNAQREAKRDYWYRGASDEVKAYVGGSKSRFDGETGITYRTADAQREFFDLVARRLAPVLDRRFDLASVADAPLRGSLQALAAVHGAGLSWFPESVVLRVDDAPRAPRYFSILRNTGHLNVSHLLREGKALLPEENTLTVVPGFIGAYPNAILHAKPAELPALAASIAGLGSDADYAALADRFVIRRTNADFWAASDAMIDAYARLAPLEAGLFDYSRLENR
jgi:hypothetical protein